MSNPSFLPELTEDPDLEEARLQLSMAGDTVERLAAWTTRYGEVALNALEDQAQTINRLRHRNH